MRIVDEANKIRQQSGNTQLLLEVFGFVYRRMIWPFLPKEGHGECNGIKVNTAVAPRRRWFDSIVPWMTPSNQIYYEKPLVAGLRTQIKEGDDVVIVGGGNGVTSVVAAKQAGAEGAVRIYEGSAQQIKVINSTLALNDVEDRCTVIHSIVGDAISLRGKEGNAYKTSPSSLPECDVLELDCEGAELEILRNLTVYPRVIIVETHSHLGSPAQEVKIELNQLGYRIVEWGTEGGPHDIYVLTATKQNHN